MAKKKASRGEFNMSAEIRDLLTADGTLTGREVFETLQAKFPGTQINEASCNVAFSNARKALGIRKSGRGKVVRRRRPVDGRPAAAVPQNVSLEAIRAACDLLAKAGSQEAAIGIIRSLQPLNKA